MRNIPRENATKLSQTAFDERFFLPKKPVVLEGGANHWKAVQCWGPEYFLKIIPEKQIGIFLFERKNDQWQRALLEGIPMKQAIEWMQENQNPDRKYYILKDGISKNYPELSNDFSFPAWAPSAKTHFANLWFGESGNTTPLHYDTVENFLVQIYGRKQVRLFSPQDTPYLYPHHAQTGGRLNFSRIRDLDAPLDKTFPLFAHAEQHLAILEPGDMLYLPPGWWHEVRTLDLGISLNFWFNPSRDKGPLWHVLGYLACRLEEGRLSQEEIQTLYMCTWANTLDVAESMRTKGHLWLSVLLCGAWLKSQSQVAPAFETLIQQASHEDNSLLTDEQVKELLLHTHKF